MDNKISKKSEKNLCKKMILSDMIMNITKENSHGEINFGHFMGKEIQDNDERKNS